MKIYRMFQKKRFWALMLLSLPVAPLVAVALRQIPMPADAQRLAQRLDKAQHERYGADISRQILRIEGSPEAKQFLTAGAPFLERVWAPHAALAPSAQPLLEAMRQRWAGFVDRYVRLTRSGAIYPPSPLEERDGAPSESRFSLAYKVRAVEGALASLAARQGNLTETLARLEAAAHATDSFRPQWPELSVGARRSALLHYQALLGFRPDKASSHQIAKSLRGLAEYRESSGSELALLPEQRQLGTALTGLARLREVPPLNPYALSTALGNIAWEPSIQAAFIVREDPFISWTYPRSAAQLALGSLCRKAPQLLTKNVQQLKLFADLDPAIVTLYLYQVSPRETAQRIRRHRVVESRRLLLEAAFEARCFHTDRNAWPAAVQELVPAYLAQLPDPPQSTTSTSLDLARYYRQGPVPYAPLRAGFVPLSRALGELLGLDDLPKATIQQLHTEAVTSSPGQMRLHFDVIYAPEAATNDAFSALLLAEALRHRPSGIVTSVTLWRSAAPAPNTQTWVKVDESKLTRAARESASRKDLSGLPQEPQSGPFLLQVEMLAPEKVYALWCSDAEDTWLENAPGNTKQDAPKRLIVFPEGL